MQENEHRDDTGQVVVIVERRAQRPRNLSSAEVMKILRKRSAARRGARLAITPNELP